MVPPFFSGQCGPTVKSLLTGGELFLFKATCVAALLSFLSCRLFVAAGVYGTALIHIEGAFEESSSVQLFFFSSTLLSCPYLHLSVNLCLVFFLFFSLCLCLCLFPPLKKSTFVFRYSISVFFHLHYTCLLRCSPPSFFSSSHTTLLSHKPFLCLSLGFFLFCRLKLLCASIKSLIRCNSHLFHNLCLHVVLFSVFLHSFFAIKSRPPTFFFYNFQTFRWGPFCIFVIYSYHLLVNSSLKCRNNLFMLVLNLTPILLFCFTLPYPASSSFFVFDMFCRIWASYYISCLPPFSLHPTCLFPVCIFLTLSSPLLFIWHPSLLPLLLFCTHFHLTYIYVYTLDLFYFPPLFFSHPS